jgi:hypothetical protein
VGCAANTLYSSGMIATLHTGRLLLQPLRLADAEQTQRLFPQWEIVQFMTTLIPWPYPADGRLLFIAMLHSPRWSAARRGIGPCGCGNHRKIICFGQIAKRDLGDYGGRMAREEARLAEYTEC